MRVIELVAFIKEREAIRIAKEAGHPRSLWTKDPILAKYRFCNVRREDDRVTRWIAENWREPHKDWEDLWFAMVVARLFNLPSTLQAIQPWVMAPKHFKIALRKLRAKGPIFNGAYIVSTNGKAMDKVDYIIDLVLKPLWKDRKSIRPHSGDTLESWHQKLMMYDGLGSFMAAQVVADMKYVEPLKSASDWWTFAASGPGSRRGLARVLWNEIRPISEDRWRAELAILQEVANARLLLSGKQWGEPLEKGLHAQDLQNCLCEFDKYERARLGEGKPKQLYKEEKK